MQALDSIIIVAFSGTIMCSAAENETNLTRFYFLIFEKIKISPFGNSDAEKLASMRNMEDKLV